MPVGKTLASVNDHSKQGVECSRLVNSEGTKVEGLIELNVSSEFQTVVGEAFEVQSEHSRE